jgi:hypothetical protein
MLLPRFKNREYFQGKLERSSSLNLPFYVLRATSFLRITTKTDYNRIDDVYAVPLVVFRYSTLTPT